MVDQLAARWVEACLAGAAPLPNIARLQARGTTFRHAISSNPICSPARATIATGLTTRHHGMLLNGYNLDPSIPTFMQALQAAGWRTGAFGKLHLRSQYESLFPDYRPYGFEVQDITEDARGGPWLEWIRTTHPEHLDAALSTVWGRSFPGFKCHGPEGVDLAARFPSTPELYGAYELPFPEEISQTNWTTERAVDFIRATDRDQSLFAQVSYVQPHDPYAPPPGYLDRVAADRLPEPLPAEWADDPCTPPIFHDMGGRATPAPEWRRDRHHYFADLCHLDRQLGVLEAALAETGRLDDTVIIFLSDHGDLLHDHGLKLKGGLHYDACLRVPLVIAGPGLQRGRERSELVQLEDICPTIHELAGVEVPNLSSSAPAVLAAGSRRTAFSTRCPADRWHPSVAARGRPTGETRPTPRASAATPCRTRPTAGRGPCAPTTGATRCIPKAAASSSSTSSTTPTSSATWRTTRPMAARGAICGTGCSSC